MAGSSFRSAVVSASRATSASSWAWSHSYGRNGPADRLLPVLSRGPGSGQSKLLLTLHEQLAEAEVQLLAELLEHPLAQLGVAPLGLAAPAQPQRQLDIAALQVHV